MEGCVTLVVRMMGRKVVREDDTVGRAPTPIGTEQRPVRKRRSSVEMKAHHRTGPTSCKLAPDDRVSLGRALDFMRLLWAVEHGIGRISRHMEQALGLTGPQRLVVRLLGQRPGISAGALPLCQRE
jgi:hypothetical protein